MSPKEKYRDYCSKKTDMIIFQRNWWLDAVCGENNWDAAIHENNGDIIAAWAYPVKSKYGLKLINMPLLTPGLGPVITYFPGQKYASVLSHDYQVLEDLINQLPKFDYFNQRFLPLYKNHMAFYWKGFQQTTRYSYRLKDLSNPDKMFEEFNSSIRSQIRKAEKNITISETEDVEVFYKLNSLTFERQEKKIPYSLNFVKRIEAVCTKNNCRKILLAKDAEGNVHGAIYMVWDTNSAYYLMGGADENYRSSGAYTLLIWHAIKAAASVTKQFDFCGSMIAPIERYFRSFGGEQVPYFHLKKTNSKALKLFFAFKED